MSARSRSNLVEHVLQFVTEGITPCQPVRRRGCQCRPEDRFWQSGRLDNLLCCIFDYFDSDLRSISRRRRRDSEWKERIGREEKRRERRKRRKLLFFFFFFFFFLFFLFFVFFVASSSSSSSSSSSLSFSLSSSFFFWFLFFVSFFSFFTV